MNVYPNTLQQPLRINDGAAPQMTSNTSAPTPRWAANFVERRSMKIKQDTDTSTLGATFGPVQQVLRQYTLIFPWQVSFAWAMPDNWFGITRECKRFTFLPNALQITHKKNLYWMPPEVSTDIIPRYRIVGIHLKTTTSPPLASVWAGWIMMIVGGVLFFPFVMPVVGGNPDDPDDVCAPAAEYWKSVSGLPTDVGDLSEWAPHYSCVPFFHIIYTLFLRLPGNFVLFLIGHLWLVDLIVILVGVMLGIVLPRFATPTHEIKVTVNTEGLGTPLATLIPTRTFRYWAWLVVLMGLPGATLAFLKMFTPTTFGFYPPPPSSPPPPPNLSANSSSTTIEDIGRRGLSDLYEMLGGLGPGMDPGREASNFWTFIWPGIWISIYLLIIFAAYNNYIKKSQTPKQPQLLHTSILTKDLPSTDFLFSYAFLPVAGVASTNACQSYQTYMHLHEANAMNGLWKVGVPNPHEYLMTTPMVPGAPSVAPDPRMTPVGAEHLGQVPLVYPNPNGAAYVRTTSSNSGGTNTIEMNEAVEDGV